MVNGITTLRQITDAGGWRIVVESFLSGISPMPADQDDFGTYWIEGGHRIREQLADDRVLSRLLRLALPPYDGGPVKLFRGENLDRLSVGLVGFAWTSQFDVAEMFAAGLNAVGSGGVVITATLDAPAIISGPNAHSRYLGELQFTVDPFHEADYQSVVTFPALEA